MKFSRFTLFIILFLFTSTLWAKPVKITGILENARDFKKVYLYEYLGSKISKIDSTQLQAGKFTFNLRQAPARGFYRIGVSDEKSFVIILADEHPVVKADLAKQPLYASVEQSKENQVYEQYRQYNQQFGENVAQLEQKAKQLSSSASEAQQEQEMNKLRAAFDSLLNAQSAFNAKLASENKGLFAAKVAGLYVKQANENAENFFAGVDFNDEELAHGDMLQSKIVIYLQRYVQPSVELWEAAAHDIIEKTKAKSKVREATYISLVNLFAQADPGLARRVANKYKSEFTSSKHAAEFLAALPPAAPEVGDLAPDIRLADRDGKELPLSSLKGKVVLLDFWAAWCGPCRHENPNVVKAYNKYKDKGFTVYSVSLDNNRDAWLKAIEKDNLIWPSHVSDLKGWQSAGAALYQVRGIPATFLIGKDGKIVAKNLRGAQLEKKLAELLDK